MNSPCVNCGADARVCKECDWYNGVWISKDQKGEIKMVTNDNVNPDHYKKSTSLECIEAMQIVFGDRAVINFCLCNAWKYVWRWKNKNGQEDLKKANWYVDKGSELLEKNALKLSREVSINMGNILYRLHLYINENLEEEDGTEKSASQDKA